MSWSSAEELRVPCARVESLVAVDGSDEAVRWLRPDQLPLLMVPGEAASEILCLGLTAGAELIGVQVCGYPQPPPEPKTTHQIARGFVHAAALALSNARLVEELERSNSVKTYFAATMSHELRNTLFAIGGFGDMLVEALEASDGDPLRLAQTISARARDSLAMIQAALELTRSEVRPPGPDVGEVAVADLLQKIAAETHVPSEKPGLAVEWDVPAGLPALRTDAIKLAMVLKNLIGNAIKFTERGTVRIGVGALDGAMRFAVADSGVGIDASEVPHLFEPFRQAHGARSRRAGGAGLGLYIVSRLVELLGGAVTVESRPGGGTTFTVTLPLAPPAPA
jgi:signal transduction histidine kinase